MSVDAQVRQLEQWVAIKPDDGASVRRLVNLLETPRGFTTAFGAFGTAQSRINESLGFDWRLGMLDRRVYSDAYRQWMSILETLGITQVVPVAQMFSGRVLTINGQHTHCDVRLKFFKETKVIPSLCHDCFKVQILPENLDDLFLAYFLLLNLDLPNDNARKCMIELRSGIKYPYKGYIYCQSLAEAKSCLAAFDDLKTKHAICGLPAKISHGCSEFGQEYPDFKYEGSDEQKPFKTPQGWAADEKNYFRDLKLAKPGRQTNNKSIISLRDVFVFRTWVRYAQLIGDETSARFGVDSGPSLFPAFDQRVRRQSKTRNAEMNELECRS